MSSQEREVGVADSLEMRMRSSMVDIQDLHVQELGPRQHRRGSIDIREPEKVLDWPS
jgi:hypothetical protein